MTQPNQPTAIVRDALADLRPFQIADPYTAATFLAAWRRRTELSADNLNAVLAEFPNPVTSRRVQLESEMAARYTPPLLEPVIFAGIADRMPPGVPELAPLGAVSAVDVAGTRWYRLVHKPIWRDDAGYTIHTSGLLHPVRWFDADDNEIIVAPQPLRAEFPAELGPPDDLDSAGPELAGFLARADTDGRMRVTEIDGPQILARLAVDRGYAKGLYQGGTVYQLQLTDAGRDFAGGAQ